jgi:hypothetical protein
MCPMRESPSCRTKFIVRSRPASGLRKGGSLSTPATCWLLGDWGAWVAERSFTGQDSKIATLSDQEWHYEA